MQKMSLRVVSPARQERPYLCASCKLKVTTSCKWTTDILSGLNNRKHVESVLCDMKINKSNLP